MVLQTFAKNCTNSKTTQLRIRLLGKCYENLADCEFIYYGDYEKDYENGYWNGVTPDKRTPRGNPWKYTTFDHVSAYDENSIIVYVSEASEWKPYFKSNWQEHGEKYGQKKLNNLL